MDWLILTVLGAVVVKLVERTMDTLLDRWRKRRHTPLSPAQTRRRYAVRFWIAAASCALYAWAALAAARAAIEAGSTVAGAIAAFVAVGAVLFGRSARRRWKWWREFRGWK